MVGIIIIIIIITIHYRVVSIVSDGFNQSSFVNAVFDAGKFSSSIFSWCI